MNMRKMLLVLMLLLGLGAALGLLVSRYVPPARATSAALDPHQAQQAERFVDLLDQSAFGEALQMTTPQVQAALADGKLQSTWETMSAQLGERRTRAAARGEQVDGYPIVTIALGFALLTLDARFSFDADHRIQGFRLVPAASAPPAPVAFESSEVFVEQPLMIGADPRSLGATLTLPRGDGPFPLAVLVHGSGPHDRDASIGPNKPFRDLARALAAHGIATLRYDKRTKTRPQDFADGDFGIDDETTDDAVAAVEAATMLAQVDASRIYLIGHSQGAMMAPRIAQRAPRIAGLVLLAAPARPLAQIYLDQIRFLAAIDGRIDAEETAHIASEQAKADAVATLTSDSPHHDSLLGLPGRYWVDLRDYDPVSLAARLPQRVFVAQGGRDYQVTPEGDFARWQAAFGGDPRFQLRRYETLNHLMIAGSGPPSPRDYAQAGRVDATLIDDIAAWIGAAP